MPALPEVSLITSWQTANPTETDHLTGLVRALNAGIGLFDLYFVNPADIKWYGDKAAGSGLNIVRTPADLTCPLMFAASLEPIEIERIAAALLDMLIIEYGGRLIGPRPRFTALATFWPLITSDQVEQRNLSIRATQNSLLLAQMLGCRHVEIVGGFAFSGNDGSEAITIVDRQNVAKEVKRRRLVQLAASLEAVFSDPRGQQLKLMEATDTEKNLCVCLEIEPGSAYLINTVQSYHQMSGLLNLQIRPHVLFNVDIAHMFLAGGENEERSNAGAGQQQLEYILANNLQTKIGHFHVSDHARTHAADLCPGTYHFFEPDYRPWFELGVKLVGSPNFSNAMAVEMEACSDIHEVLRAVGRTNSWLHKVASNDRFHGKAEGAMISVDIINSTKVLALEGVDLELGALRIDTAVSAMCKCVHKHRGSVYSFTGDGLVAMFDQNHFQNLQECARHSIKASEYLYSAMKAALMVQNQWKTQEEADLGLRIAIHWGQAMIPSHGSLRHQIIGRDIVIVCRLLNAHETQTKSRIVASEKLLEKLTPNERDGWTVMPDAVLEDETKFKGLRWTTTRVAIGALYVRNEVVT